MYILFNKQHSKIRLLGYSTYHILQPCIPTKKILSPLKTPCIIGVLHEKNTDGVNSTAILKFMEMP